MIWDILIKHFSESHTPSPRTPSDNASTLQARWVLLKDPRGVRLLSPRSTPTLYSPPKPHSSIPDLCVYLGSYSGLALRRLNFHISPVESCGLLGLLAQKYAVPVLVVSCRPPPLSLPRIVYWDTDQCAVMPQGLISSSVQIFFAWRIKVLSANLILFLVIVVLAIPQFGTSTILRPSDRPPLVGPFDPDMRLSSFHSWWNSVHHLNR